MRDFQAVISGNTRSVIELIVSADRVVLAAFMVADEVTIDTLSYKEGATAVHWSCDGGTEFDMNQEKAETDMCPSVVKNMCRTVVRTVAMEEKAEMSFS